MEGLVMHTRYLLIATAALAAATNAVAEPVKSAPQAESQASTTRPAAVMMASADQIQTPAPIAAQAQDSIPAKRPRAARVTTCRCAGQNQR
jgi:hypothetical protein